MQNDGNGTASASLTAAAPGTEITLTANAAPGYQFKEWQVVEPTGLSISGNSFHMPASNVTIKAIFEQIPGPVPPTQYTVTVNCSNAAVTGAGSYEANKTVSIDAGSRSGYSFSGWTSSDGVTFTDPNSPTTTFTMPEKAVTVTANWTYIGSPVIPTYDYYTITATAGAGGSISPSGEITIREGRDKTFTLTPEEGYEVSDILIDGKSAGAAEVYTVENIRKDTTVEAVFAETEEHRNARLKAGVENTSIKAWSSAEKGKIKVNWKKSYGFKVDGYEIFRSAKKNTGYGTKAFFKTTKTRNPGWYKNTKQLKKGARYYYKVRGYRTIGGEKVYTRWSNSACRIAK